MAMLGIVIGIASVILMISIGQAAENYLLSQVASYGSDLVLVANGSGEVQAGPPNIFLKQTLTNKDYKKLKNLSWTRGVSASVITTDLVTFGKTNVFSTISGTSQDELELSNLLIAYGRYLDETDLDSRSRVVVLGQKVAKNLFGEEDPIGKKIKINKLQFRVIGILQKAGTQYFTDMDQIIAMPFTTFFDVYNKNRLQFLTVKTGDIDPNEAKELIRITMRESHNISNPENDLTKDDFSLSTRDDAVESANVIGLILQILLTSIASVSLFVAGIGIMNIMYVNVTERTQEIGLRKAIGAAPGDVLGQFLIESILLTMSAGIAGIVLGVALTWIAIQIILQFQTGWSFVVPLHGVIVAFVFAATVGIVFGYFPARRAAKLRPVESLRYE